MIRLVFPLRRRRDIGLSDFHEYWLRRHAPLVASHQESLGIMQYVQTHRWEKDGLAEWLTETGVDMESPYDGVAELWYQSEEAMLAGGSSPRAREAAYELLEDERRFIDLENSPLWLAAEWPGPHREKIAAVPNASLKVMCFWRTNGDVGGAEARNRWMAEPGPLVPAVPSGPSRLPYRRVIRVESAVEGALRRARGTVVEAYMGHEETWLPDDDPVGETGSRGDRPVWSRAASYIDLARSSVWSGMEHLIIHGA